ncbi:MAG: RNA 2',3'-cyclic phosphodiesterase [Candidatus Omnitrophica bacterium]|nr:RNA 2',3'-cyclic phosphodiesterase [Candidatus Omnitrophota bacterium]
MRAFIAIELPQEIKDKLAQLQALLKESRADVKWVEPKNIHLTLKFLGEIDEDKSVKISGIIEDIAKESRQFPISLSSLGAFPKLDFARVIWIGIDKGDQETKLLAKGLEERIEKLGILKEERVFSTHITIGRVRSPLNKDKLAEALKKLGDYFAGKNIKFTVTKITLFKSTLGSSGPVYEALKTLDITTT